MEVTHRAYDAMGGLDGAVAVRAERAIGEFLPEGEHELQRLLLQLVRSADGTPDTRRRVTVGELDDRTEQMVAVLTDARLLVAGRDPVSDNQTLEIAHEALIQSWQRLRGWIDANREFLVWRDRLTASLDGWRSGGEDPGALLRGGPLVEAERWRNERGADLTVEERAFIDAGVEQRDAELQAEQRARQRRQRILWAGLAFFAAVAMLAGGIAWRQAAAAQSERDDAVTSLGAAEDSFAEIEAAGVRADAEREQIDQLAGEIADAEEERDAAERARDKAQVAAADSLLVVSAAEADVAEAAAALEVVEADVAAAEAEAERARADASAVNSEREAAERAAETALRQRDEALKALEDAEAAQATAERDAAAAQDELAEFRTLIGTLCSRLPGLVAAAESVGIDTQTLRDLGEAANC